MIKIELTKHIIRLFRELGAKPIILLKTDKADDIVSNGSGVEFELPEYAIICEKDPILLDDDKYGLICEFEFENNVNILKFGNTAMGGGVIARLKLDGYEEIWERNTN